MSRNKFPRERGVYASLTPRRDFSEDLEHLIGTGQCESIGKLCHPEQVCSPRRKRYDESTGRKYTISTYGSFGADEEAYFKMWEDISGMKVNDDGFLERRCDENRNTVESDILRLLDDEMLHSRPLGTLQGPKLRMNAEIAMRIFDDDEDEFLRYFTPLLFGKADIRLQYINWLREKDIYGIEAQYMCAIYDITAFQVKMHCLFVRKDFLKKYMNMSAMENLEIQWKLYQSTYK